MWNTNGAQSTDVFLQAFDHRHTYKTGIRSKKSKDQPKKREILEMLFAKTINNDSLLMKEIPRLK